MAVQKWVTVGEKDCDLIGLHVQLLEHRVYPSETASGAEAYRLIGCKCTADIACNLANIPCQLAYTSPASNRF